MTNKTLDRLSAELDGWRARLEHLRVQLDLGEKEARDKLDQVEELLHPAIEKSRKLLEEIVASGTGEARTLAKSLGSGWDELRRTHHELSREAERSKTRGGTDA